MNRRLVAAAGLAASGILIALLIGVVDAPAPHPSSAANREVPSQQTQQRDPSLEAQHQRRETALGELAAKAKAHHDELQRRE